MCVSAAMQVWFQNARAKHRRAMTKHEQKEPQQRQPQSHQLYPRQHHQQHQETVAAASGLHQSTGNAAVAHQLVINPIDDRITDFSLYENTLNDYSCITK